MSDLKYGDKVEVKHDAFSGWTKTYFIDYTTIGIRAVKLADRESFMAGGAFAVNGYVEWRKPKKPEYIPFTFEERNLLKGRYVKSKENSDEEFLISNIFRSGVKLSNVNCVYLYESILKKFVFDDGSPCGKLKDD